MKRNASRAALAATLMSSTLVLAAAGAGAETIPTPATGSFAEGVALQVKDVLTVGGTQAKADGSGGTATGNAVELLGTVVSGGTQTGVGESSDSVLDTGATALGQLQVAPWSAKVSETPTARTSESKAAAARLTVVDPNTAHVNVLQSESTATHTGAASTGHSSSDGATVSLGGPAGVNITLLHSEMDSSGKGATWLLDINGTRIGAQDQRGACLFDLTPTLGIGCMVAGAMVPFASVLGADVAGLVQVTGVASSARGGTAVMGVDVGRDTAGRAADMSRHDGARSGVLARTGSDVPGQLAVGMAMICLGLALMAFQHNRRDDLVRARVSGQWVHHS